ncbi:MAG TPA: immunoglobulin domain-containing protein [Candidatus Paceibacterota bacterium]|nr:immunoglobulin domain-containing protein [Verrucomicrobiota bacterium]HOX03002.1 immunoglobulin domain-containing protein [Verrucomicrobiota bacterium]HRZ45861.1 immunoglobulin domain-containing protein [Candidatus Paceibacterota bacterium]HRZ56050.1 immunoglobulin domain-containing protein [Candidatus Paceibacterota bacterium]
MSTTIRKTLLSLFSAGIFVWGAYGAQLTGVSVVPEGGLGGTHSISGNTHVLVGCGADIWGTTDAFYFLHQSAPGDFDIVAKLQSFDASASDWAKAGIMVREALIYENAFMFAPGDRYLCVQSQRQASPASAYARFQYRPATDSNVTDSQAGAGPLSSWPDNWLRLRRMGSVYRAYAGTDGTNWTQIMEQDTASSAWGGLALGYDVWTTSYLPVAVGLFCTSHNAGNTNAVATFTVYGENPVKNPVQISQQPAANTTLQINRKLTLTVAVTGYDPFTYQWKKGGVNIQDATNATFEIAAVALSDSGTYSVEVKNFTPNANTVLSENAVVNVVDDAVPPEVVDVGGMGSTVSVVFNEQMDAASIAGATAQVTGQTVTGAALSADKKSVVLTLAGTLTPGAGYSVSGSGLKDLAGNTMAPLSGTFTASKFLFAQVGKPVKDGTAAAYGSSGFDVQNAGRTMWAAYDETSFVYQQLTGDFDIKVRVNQESSSEWARVGLMARQNLDAGLAEFQGDGVTPNQFSAYVEAHANPPGDVEYDAANLVWTEGIDAVARNYECNRRQTLGGATDGWLSTTPSWTKAPYPDNVWLRLGRMDNTLKSYASTNGTDWVQTGSWDWPSAPAAMYAGPHYCVENGNIDGNTDPVVQNRLFNATFRDVSMAPLQAVNITASPAPVTVAENSSATFTAAGTGEPLRYQWYRGTTPVAGATGPTLAIKYVKMADAGDYRCRVFNFGNGAADFGTEAYSTAATLTVTPDVTPPAITRVAGNRNFDRIVVTFSEPMNAAARTASYYTFNPPLTVSGVTANADGTEFTLTTSQQAQGAEYTLTMNSAVKDTAGLDLVSTTKAFYSVMFNPNMAKREVFSPTDVGDHPTIANWVIGASGTPPLYYQETISGLLETSDYGDALNDFSQRVWGWLKPPETGTYYFYMGNDDSGRIYLSTDDNPANLDTANPVAGHNGWGERRMWLQYHEWANDATQTYDQSIKLPAYLEANKYYYFVATCREGGGGDYITMTWQLPSVFEAPANYTAPVLTGDYFGLFLDPNLSSVTFSQQPQSQSVPVNHKATFTVEATGASEFGGALSYQWQKGGVNIDGATSPSYTTAYLTTADNNTKYRCMVTVPGKTVPSDEATLTVISDTVPPVVQTINGLNGALFVVFDELLDPVTAATLANYVLGTGSASAAELLADQMTVKLTVTGVTTAGTAVTVSNVKDLAGNALAAPVVKNATYSNLIGLDIGNNVGTDPLPGTQVMRGPADFDMFGGGHDIYGGDDAFRFVYEPWSGDFDAVVKVESLDFTSRWSKAGIMFRETLDPNSRHANVHVMPEGTGTAPDNSSGGADGYDCQWRQNIGGDTATWPGTIANTANVPYPNAWMRFTRAGNLFTGYRSTDGKTWTQMHQSTMELSTSGYLGLMLTAHWAGGLAQAVFKSYDPTYSPLDPELAELSIALEGGNVTISWPKAAGPFRLQSAPAVTGEWTVISAGITESGDNYTYTVAAEGAAKFFRLIE